MLQINAAVLLLALGAGCLASAQTEAPIPAVPCGTVVALDTRPNSFTRYSWAPGHVVEGASNAGMAFILLVGGGGNVDLDDAGCPRRLKGNILVRTAPLFQHAGITTALVDAPSDWSSGDGLAGFRIQPEHAADMARVIADVRARTGATVVWVLGHSRGSLSAANAAGRLRGVNAPDGVVLASPMLRGEPSKRKPWVSQTISNTDLKAFTGSLLLVGHAADNCARSLPEHLDAAVEGFHSVRMQVVRITGGPRIVGRPPSLSTCEVHEAHDFVDQDAEFVQGVLRFVRGGRF